MGAIKQRFHGPVGQVAGGDIEHHYWLEPRPPDDPDKSTQCPQCCKLTWRHSQHCMHCQLDLFAWAAARRRGLTRGRLLRVAAHVAGAAVLFAGGAALSALAVPAQTQRSKAVVAEFKRHNPCPSTGKSRGACPGYEADHVQALCAGGTDTADNMQWLSIEAHADKTRRDLAACAGRAYKPPVPLIP